MSLPHNAFLPSFLFDAHAHVSYLGNTPYGIGEYLQFQKDSLPNTETLGGNAIVMPLPEMADRQNGLRDQSSRLLAEDLERHKNFVGEVIVLPDDTDADVERQLLHDRIRGLKCYHFFSPKKPTQNADVCEYLPESAWRVANDRGLCITLHLVKDAALSDTENMSYLLDHARRYPNAKLILAHCGRAFAAWTVIDRAARFADLPNVFFDLSGICEPVPMMECIRAVGSGRVLWGSDFPISSQKGKAISLGSGFLWLLDGELERLGVASAELVLCEELRAFGQASRLLDLSPLALDEIFYKNARSVFGL